jgi:O-antigen/teichoic acid export membrane protein
VLPFALAGCVWFGIIATAQNYLWCAEKARLGCVPILAGVLLNIGLNLILLPRFGLVGAVSASAAANLTALAFTYLLGTRCGLKFDSGVAIVLALPPLFCAGPWILLAALAGITTWAVQGNYLLNREEKDQLRNVARGYLCRFRGMKTALSG